MTMMPAANGGNQFQLKLDHRGQESFWDISTWGEQFRKVDPVEHINRFWAMQSQEKQDAIWAIYVEMDDAFHAMLDTRGLMSRLMVSVAKLMEPHDIDTMLEWIAFHGDIQEPADIEETYMSSDDRPSKTEEKTYVRAEYRRLIAMALGFRTMIPVWGRFIERTTKDIGTELKEYYGFLLLQRAAVIHSDTMQKLAVYVERNIKADESMTAAIMGGLSTDEYPRYILGRTVVRRVCVGDIRGQDQMSHLVKYIFNYLRQTHRPVGTMSFGRMIKDKEFDDPNKSNDNSISRMEGYKITQDIPIGDLSILDNPFNDLHALARQLRPDIDLALFEQFHQYAQPLLVEPPYTPQVRVTQWIMKPVVSPRGLTRLSRARMVAAMAIAQTCLWMDEQYHLACLLTALATDAQQELMLGSDRYGMHIPKELREALFQCYPWQRMTQARKKTRPTNVGVEAIELVAADFSARDWELMLPPKFTSKVTNNPNRRRYSSPSELKIMLANLLLQINLRPYRASRDKFSPTSPDYVGNRPAQGQDSISEIVSAPARI